MRYRIEEIEGIGPHYAKLLGREKIVTARALLQRCGKASGRRVVSAATGISETLLLKWTNRADLMRISGIGKQFSELLEASGVDTVKELRKRKAANLAAKMSEVNSQKKLARVAPSEKSVAKWIEAAARLQPMVSH